MISANRPSFVKPVRADDATTPPLKTWSFSALQVYEQCPYRSYLQRVKKIAQPSSPAADRGSQIHDLAEQYVNGEYLEDKCPKELLKFETEFRVLRDGYPNGKIILEQDWGYNRDWEQTGWMAPDVWLRSKLDVFIQESVTSAIVIDHKTGRKFGNELKHNSQLMLYAISAFVRFPKLQHVTAKLWYLDKGESTTQQYTREQAMLFFPKWNARALAMTNAINFPPTPNKVSCKWCSYGKPDDDGTLACEDVHMEL
jgi:hypothetical protein